MVIEVVEPHCPGADYVSDPEVDLNEAGALELASWRVAPCLDVLLRQLNTRYPLRSKASDGSIGDATHQTTSSDHNAHCGPGIVTARDFTHDPAHGVDIYRLSNELAASKDTRIKYIICNRLILDSRAAFQPWKWRPYRGSNPHTKHLHLSVLCGPGVHDTRPWNLPMLRPAQEDDMPLTDADIHRIADVTAHRISNWGFADPGPGGPDDRNWVQSRETRDGVRRLLAEVAKLRAAVAELEARP